MLPNYNIENRGVPGYGLTQMYLKLQRTLIEKDTPVIAVFNYGNFQDKRTANHNFCSALIVKAITNGYSKRFKNISYPYMNYKNDSLTLHYCPVNQLPKFWPFYKHSVLISLLNNVYFNSMDNKNTTYLSLISKMTALKIAQYCQLNHIIPIFASVTPESIEILEFLHQNGYFVINYGIKIDNEMTQSSIYNCGPLDSGHPSALAHTIYAKKLFKFISDSISNKSLK